MKKIIFIIALVFGCLTSVAQSSKEELFQNLNKTGGVYFAYPEPSGSLTPAPDGYKPFYISHYGRHGSRYLISTDDYVWIRNLLNKAKQAGELTLLGEDVLARIDSVLLEADGRGGDLSPLGVRQHRRIAERMMANYPEVFADSTEISARSTVVVRCVLSMDAFCERLKELNPTLQITRESSQKYMPYLCYGSQEADAKRKQTKEHLKKFREEKTHPDRLMSSLFKYPEYVWKNVNPYDLMWGLYYLASDMQDMETELSFYDLFTPEELFDLWQVFNFDFYIGSGNYEDNEGLMIANAGNLLLNIIDTADEALKKENTSATLRFGHDGNLIPLAGILEFPSAIGKTGDPEKVYEVFADFKVAPMAGNVQIIFFKNEHDSNSPVLVKFLLNEEEQHIPVDTDNWPFYNWTDVRKYYLNSQYLKKG